MAAEVVWFSENFTLEMPTIVKNTSITNEEYHITLRKGARPFINRERPIAFELRDQVIARIRNLVTQGTLISWEEADRTSPIVVVKKCNGAHEYVGTSGNKIPK